MLGIFAASFSMRRTSSFLYAGRSGFNGLKGKDGASESRNDGEFVLTYEDKDGDWMLVGDVPWK